MIVDILYGSCEFFINLFIFTAFGKVYKKHFLKKHRFFGKKKTHHRQ